MNTEDAVLLDGVEDRHCVLTLASSYESLINAEASIAKLESISLGLESIVDGLRIGQSDGDRGLNVHMYVAAVGSILQPVGGLESFPLVKAGLESSTDKLFAGVEAASTVLGHVWEAIKVFMRGLVKLVTNFFTDMFSSVARIKAKAESLSKSASDLRGAPVHKELIVGERTTALLKVGGGGSFIDELKHQTKVTESYLRSNGTVSAASVLASTMLNSVKADDATERTKYDQEIFNAISNLQKANVERFNATEKVDSGDKRWGKQQAVRSKEIIGGKAFFCADPSDYVPGKSTSVSLITRFADSAHGKRNKTGETMPALSASEILEAAAVVSNLCGAILTFKKEDETIRKMNVAFVDAGDRIEQYSKSKGEGFIARMEIKSKLRSLRTFAISTQAPLTRYLAHIVSVNGAALKLAQLSRDNLAVKN